MIRKVQRSPGESGQGLVFTVFAMVVLIGFTAMAIDVGLLFEDRRSLQNASDAMALAGVHELPLNPIAARKKAEEWAALNNIPPDEIKTIEVRTANFPNDTLYVELTTEFDWVFGRVLGMTTSAVGAEAAARTGTLAGGHDMMPWALLQGQTECLDADGNPIFSQQCTVKVGAGDGLTGWYGALDFDGNGGGAAEYRGNIIDGTVDWNYCIEGDPAPDCVSSVPVIDSLDGNKVGPTGSGIDIRTQTPACDGDGNGKDDFDEVFKPNPAGTPAYYVDCPDSPNLIIIPIVTYESVPVHKVTIRGWSLAYLGGYDCVPNAVAVPGRPIEVLGAVKEPDASKATPCPKSQESTTASLGEDEGEPDRFVSLPIPGVLSGQTEIAPTKPNACHNGNPHGPFVCPTPTPTPGPTPAPTPPGPSATPAPGGGACGGNGHWEVYIEMVDAAYSQSAGFLGAYDPLSGITIRRLVQ